MRKITYYIVALLAFYSSGAQEVTTTEFFKPKVSYLDSIKATFKNHETSACIDERWMRELANIDLSTEMFIDIENLDLNQAVSYDLDTELLKKRLKKLDVASPFTIEYNEILENTIKSFLKNRSKSFERQMAIAAYYFPMFEEHLSKYNIPLEIKYLAIVESALQPKAKSRVGAGGLWQFMPATGKQYNLNITSYVDERHDPIKSTEAACKYMVNMYAIFGDWSLVLASYNCGPGNVSKAIRRSGGKTDYWEIRKYLPKETANYVPAFLATMYIYEFKKEHGLVPHKSDITYFETDTVLVKQAMTFKQLSDLLDVSEEQIAFFNPIYKSNYIPAQDGQEFYLRLPKNKIGLFVSNEEKIYAYLEYMATEKERNLALAALKRKDSIAKRDSLNALAKLEKANKIEVEKEAPVTYENVVKKKTKEIIEKSYHKVRPGETLSEIADKNNVSISQLRKWNNIKGSQINSGESLVIESKKKVTVNEVVKKPIYAKDLEEKQAVAIANESKKDDKKTAKEKAENIEDYYIVQKGDSIFSISKKYGNITAEDIKKKNNLKDNTIKPGMKLKING